MLRPPRRPLRWRELIVTLPLFKGLEIRCGGLPSSVQCTCRELHDWRPGQNCNLPWVLYFPYNRTVWHVLRSLTSLQPHLHWKWQQQDLLVVQTRSCRTTRNLYRDSLSCKTAHAVWPKTSLMSPFWRIEGALFFRHWCDSVYAIKLRVNCLLLCVSYVPCIVACHDAWLSLSLSQSLLSSLCFSCSQRCLWFCHRIE